LAADGASNREFAQAALQEGFFFLACHKMSISSRSPLASRLSSA
jgi:hypothetical protein